jgi:hypothetical protein
VVFVSGGSVIQVFVGVRRRSHSQAQFRQDFGPSYYRLPYWAFYFWQIQPGTWAAVAHITYGFSFFPPMDRMPSPQLHSRDGHVGQPTATHFAWLLRFHPADKNASTRLAHRSSSAEQGFIQGQRTRSEKKRSSKRLLSHGALRRPPRISGARRRRGGAFLQLRVRPWYGTLLTLYYLCFRFPAC